MLWWLIASQITDHRSFLSLLRSLLYTLFSPNKRFHLMQVGSTFLVVDWTSYNSEDFKF